MISSKKKVCSGAGSAVVFNNADVDISSIGFAFTNPIAAMTNFKNVRFEIIIMLIETSGIVFKSLVIRVSEITCKSIDYFLNDKICHITPIR